MDGSPPVRLPDTAVLRPTSGKVLTVVIALFAAVGLFSFIFRGEWREALGFTPLAVAVVYLCWLLFWYPSVTVEPSGVQVRNPLRTFQVSWPAIVRIDTRYALTLFTKTTRKIVAWSAPSPSRYAGINTVRPDLNGLSVRRGKSDVEGVGLTPPKADSVRLGDVPRSESGLAALHVRRAWAALRDAGYLDSGVLEGTGVVTRWNTAALGVGGILIVLGVLAAFLG
ncbi:MAG: PH domain-containing protein [Pseudolysinimonas sp.]